MPNARAIIESIPSTVNPRTERVSAKGTKPNTVRRYVERNLARLNGSGGSELFQFT